MSPNTVPNMASISPFAPERKLFLCRTRKPLVLTMSRMWKKKPNAKELLWRNVQALMAYEFGEQHRSNQNKLAEECGFGLGTAARIKYAGENPDDPDANSTGLDKIQQIADRFKVEPWQLLAPDFEPASATDRRKWRKLYVSLTAEERRKVFDMIEIFKPQPPDNNTPS